MTEYEGHLPTEPVPFANTPYWLPQPRPLTIENINLVFGFRKMIGCDMTTRSRYGRRRNLRYYIFNHSQKEERKNWKWVSL